MIKITHENIPKAFHLLRQWKSQPVIDNSNQNKIQASHIWIPLYDAFDATGFRFEGNFPLLLILDCHQT